VLLLLLALRLGRWGQSGRPDPFVGGAGWTRGGGGVSGARILNSTPPIFEQIVVSCQAARSWIIAPKVVARRHPEAAAPRRLPRSGRWRQAARTWGVGGFSGAPGPGCLISSPAGWLAGWPAGRQHPTPHRL